MSNNSAVVVEGLGKRYYTPQRSLAGKKSIRAHLKNMGIIRSDAEEDYFWALKDVSFEVPQGQILGIMGKNGSGKSTLLKILTGVTLPTTGRALLRGRVGSLLEVGTGFHPDMSGRDNVFMNGVLLGIPKSEIKARFDEIVDFSGIEEFIDVPVKRYSSGMYVRLAYAVTSMLRCDILILDEVLAVGDAAFQNKARKNMQQLVNDGRTILFVSHAIHQISTICKTGIVLEKGKIASQGDIKECASYYLKKEFYLDCSKANMVATLDISSARRLENCNSMTLQCVEILNKDGDPSTTITLGEEFIAKISYKNNFACNAFFLIIFLNDLGEYSTMLYSTHNCSDVKFPESGIVKCKVNSLQIPPGEYTLTVAYGSSDSLGNLQLLDYVPSTVRVSVVNRGFVHYPHTRSIDGTIHQSKWTLAQEGL